MSMIRRRFYTNKNAITLVSRSGDSPFVVMHGKLVNRLSPHLEANEVSLELLAKRLNDQREKDNADPIPEDCF